jgi:hypothetical protein
MPSKLLVSTAILLISSLLHAQDEKSSGDFIRLVDGLDEPEEFYCFDLAGWGDHLQLDDPLQTHTCKGRGGQDQMFHFDGKRLKVSLYDRCVQVAGSSGITLAGSAVLARPCSDSPLQDLSLNDAGQIQIGTTAYCLGAGEDSAEASGPSHMWRTLVTVKCDSAQAAFATWQIGMGSD